MRYYYTDVANQTQGPVELSELARLLASGSLPAQAQVCAEGETTWRPISTVLPESNATRTHIANTINSIVTNTGLRTLEWTRSRLGEDRLRGLMDFFSRAGNVLFMAGACLTLVLCVVNSIRHNNAALLGSGVLAVALLVVLQFAAQRFLRAGRELITNSPTSVNSTAMMDCLALLALAIAVGSVLLGLITAIQSNNLGNLLASIVTALGLVALAALCLSPTVLSVSVRKSTAGEEALGLISFFLKASLFVVPFSYFLAGLFGCLLVFASFFDSGAALANPFSALLPSGAPMRHMPIGVLGLLFGGFIPVTSYFWFLLFYLPLDVLQAIVCLPGKIDRTQR